MLYALNISPSYNIELRIPLSVVISSVVLDIRVLDFRLHLIVLLLIQNVIHRFFYYVNDMLEFGVLILELLATDAWALISFSQLLS